MPDWMPYFFEKGIIPLFMFFLGFFINGWKDSKKEKSQLIKEISEKYMRTFKEEHLNDENSDDRLFALQRAGALRLPNERSLEKVCTYVSAHGFRNPTKDHGYDFVVSSMHLLAWASSRGLSFRSPDQILYAMASELDQAEGRQG